MSAIPMDPRIRARRVEIMKRQGRRRLHLLVVLVAATAVAVAAWWVILHSPVFDVDEVMVRGTERTPVDAVLQASGIDEGESLVEVDVKAAKSSIAELPWIAQVQSDRDVTGAVIFTVTERTPVAALAGESGWLMVDADGRVLETVADLEADVVVVDGAKWQVEPGGWVGERALPALEVAALLPVGLRPKVASVHMAGGDIELVLFGGGRVVLGPATELDAKFLAALTMLVRLDLTCVDRIDVRAPSVPVLTRLDTCS